MNYANMIEEKNLKKTFIIATLVSTIIGTFTTGMGLYDRVDSKRKQKKVDVGQDDKIKALQKQIEEMDERQRQRSKESEERLRESLSESGPMIRREYNKDFSRFGERFARGDAITENQLQGQVIMLQGTVIQLLDEALRTGRLDNINKLYNATELARNGSIAALQSQAQRMLQEAPIKRPMTIRRISSQPSVASKPPEPLKKAKTLQMASNIDDEPLFCHYSYDLQRDNDLPLSPAFEKGGDSYCRDCNTVIEGVEPGRAWKVTKEILRERTATPDYREEVVEDHTYLILNRFIVKCHRPGSGFACMLCTRYRDKDILCETPVGLVRHIQNKHDASEYLDPDIKEIGQDTYIDASGRGPPFSNLLRLEQPKKPSASPPPPLNLTPPLTERPKMSTLRHRNRFMQKPKAILKKTVHWPDGR